MHDLISRQAAIDAIVSKLDSIDHVPQWVFDELTNVMEELPSTQPEIIRCKDCKYNVSSRKCLQPDSFFLVTSDDFYCGYAKRRTDEDMRGEQDEC